jgi:hypothetical protein
MTVILNLPPEKEAAFKAQAAGARDEHRGATDA